MANNIRIAILKAADWIENHPDKFKFSSCFIPNPHTCDTPGCALGWIGYFLDSNVQSINAVAQIYLSLDPAVTTHPQGGWDKEPSVQYAFYNRMRLIAGDAWKESASVCASTLRFYANFYHPAEPEKVFKSGAEIAREIIQTPYRESVSA